MVEAGGLKERRECPVSVDACSNVFQETRSREPTSHQAWKVSLVGFEPPFRQLSRRNLPRGVLTDKLMARWLEWGQYGRDIDVSTVLPTLESCG